MDIQEILNQLIKENKHQDVLLTDGYSYWYINEVQSILENNVIEREFELKTDGIYDVSNLEPLKILGFITIH